MRLIAAVAVVLGVVGVVVVVVLVLYMAGADLLAVQVQLAPMVEEVWTWQ